jgi:hypothetical protein
MSATMSKTSTVGTVSIEDMAEEIVHAIDVATAPLRERIAELERRASVGVKWCGVHEVGRRYLEGSIVTKDGSLWLCTDTTTERPGRGAGWRLIVKGGHGRRDND